MSLKKIFILPLLVLFGVEYCSFNNSELYTKFLEAQLVLVWGIVQYQSYKKFGIFHLYTLLMMTFFFFGVGAIFHFLISGEDIRDLEAGYGHFRFAYETIQEALWVYAVFLFLSFSTFSYIYKPKKYNFSTPVTDERLFRIGRFLMNVFLIFIVYKGYLFFTAFNGNRVLIYLTGSLASPIPRWLSFIATFFQVGYFFVVASKPSKRVFYRYSLFFLIDLIPGILIGNRGMFGAFICFFFWYVWKTYHELVMPKKYLVITGIVLLLVFQLMQFVRDGLLSELSFSPTRFLAGQGFSFYILPLYIDYANQIQFHLYPFVFYGILAGFSGYTGQSLDVLMHKCGIGHQLMYTVNSEYYLMGGSFGSSCLSELYDLGVVGFLLGSIFWPFMIRWFDRKIETKPFWSFVSFFLVTELLLSPRGMFFVSTYGIFKYYLYYKFVLVTYSITKKQR